MATTRVKEYTKTINGKLVFVPAHDQTVHHALGRDFEALLAHPKVQSLAPPKAKAPAPEAPKIPAHLMATVDEDFQGALAEIQQHAPDAPKGMTPEQAKAAGSAAHAAGKDKSVIDNSEFFNATKGLKIAEKKAAWDAYHTGWSEADQSVVPFDVVPEPKAPEPAAGNWQPKPDDVVNVQVTHNTTGNSDKVYKVSVLKFPDGTFGVVAQWGKNGGTLAQQVKHTGLKSQGLAQAEANGLQSAKMQKGYYIAGPSVTLAAKQKPIGPLEGITGPSAPAPQPEGPKEGEVKGALTFHHGRWHATKEAPNADPWEGMAAKAKALKVGEYLVLPNGIKVRLTKPDGNKLLVERTKGDGSPISAGVWTTVGILHGKDFGVKTEEKIAIPKDSAITLISMLQKEPRKAPVVIQDSHEHTGVTGGAAVLPKPAQPPTAPSGPKVGDIKVENGKTYKLNANHKWELVEESVADWKKIGAQAGSNPGGVFQESTGKKWYVKWLKSKDHVMNEILAAKLYAAAGLGVPELKLVSDGGKTGLASGWQEGLTGKADSKAPGAMEGFVVDAWLCNRDVVGEDFTNMVKDADGKAYRVDVGGSLIYRAQGDIKPGFGNEVTELKSLLDPGINSQAAATFKGISKAQLESGAAKVLGVSDQQIKDLVDEYGPGTDADKAALVAKLIARKGFIAKEFPAAAKKAETGWAVLKPGEQIVDHGEEFGVKWVKIKVPAGGFKKETIPTPPTLTSSGSQHFNNANTAAAKLIYDQAVAGANPDVLEALEAENVHKETGVGLGTTVKLTVHHSQHVKNYLTAVLAEVKAQNEPTFKTEYSGSFTGSYNTITAKLAVQFKAKSHSEFAAHKHKAADYLILSDDAAKSIPVTKAGFKERTGTEMQPFKEACAAKFGSLTQSEKNACGAYTGSAYVEWNEQMRAGVIPSGAKPMVSAMAKAAVEIPDGTILWRGINVGSSTYQSVAGALIQDGSFQSCSYGGSPAMSGKKTWLRLHIGKGVKGLQAAGVFSHFGTSESEIILPPNCRYAVMHVTDKDATHGGKTVVDILVLPNDTEVAKEAAL